MKAGEKWSLFGGVLIVAVIAYFVLRKAMGLSVAAIFDFVGFDKGKQLSKRMGRKRLNAQGYIPVSPAKLIEEAQNVMGESITADEFALAASGRSEGVNGMIYRMHVMLNQADESGISVFDMTVRESGASNGFFGEQRGRRWASPEAPYEGDILRARVAINEHAQGVDRTGGAGRYYDISAFGKQPGTRTESVVREEWLDDGYSPYHAPDATNDFVLWSRNGVPDGFDPYT